MTFSLNYTPSGVAGSDHLQKAFVNRSQDQLSLETYHEAYKASFTLQACE